MKVRGTSVRVTAKGVHFSKGHGTRHAYRKTGDAGVNWQQRAGFKVQKDTYSSFTSSARQLRAGAVRNKDRAAQRV